MKSIRIDLHLHSPSSSQNGDSIKWTSNFDSINKLKLFDIKIASFSDHNILDVDFYLEIKKLASTTNILVLPGIEVNVVRSDGNIANLIYIFDSGLSIEELRKISKIASTIPKLGISLKASEEIFSEFETIKIPHVGKSDHFKFNDLEKITFDAIEISNPNHTNYLSCLRKGLNSSIVAFSDTHRWNLYPEQNKLITEVELEEINFKNLKEVFNKKNNYTK